MTFLLNPVIVSTVVLCVLCVKKINVLLSIIIATIIAGILSGMSIEAVMDNFIFGMGGNSETALSYILLGAFAASMAHSGITNCLAEKLTSIISEKKYLLILLLAIISIASQNIIPIHIAFIPIIIPPLLPLMNKLKIDRKLISTTLAFGLKMPYIALPVGFGLIFHNLIADNLVQNGVNVLRADIWKSTFILGIAMLVGFIVSLYIYRKPREYKINANINNYLELKNEKTCSKYAILVTLLAAILTFVVQILTSSLPLGALVGLGLIFSLKVISKDKMDHMMNEGIYMMGYVAFVMLVAAGFASVLKTSGAIEALVNSVIILLPQNIILVSFIILIIGLFLTIGIGTSFGTIPILAVIFVPICVKLGFNPQQIVVLIAAAAALGDAGSPASDTTLGPTAGLNVDGQHNHIFDTCIPTFIHYNTLLIIFALVGVHILN